MAEEPNREEGKKSFPFSFFLFLLIAVLLVVTAQNFINRKEAAVSYSYQAEHLINLDVLQEEHSLKTAMNDQLVSFSGKFRDQKTELGEERFKYLSLLNKNHELHRQDSLLSSELSQLQKKINVAANLFLQLSDLPIPPTGYVVVGAAYDTADRTNRIVVSKISTRDVIGFLDLKTNLKKVEQEPSIQALDGYRMEALGVLSNFLSPQLGIGSERIKRSLRTLSKEVKSLDEETPSSEQIATFKQVIISLEEVIAKLSKSDDLIRLNQLRSIRSYKESIEKYQKVTRALNDNEMQLGKVRKQVAGVIWYFNDQELTSRALEKQDPEVFQNWYDRAQEEWKAFESNKGGFFRAPDQPRNLVLEKTFKSKEPAPNYLSYIFTALPVILVILLLYFMFSRQMKGGAGGGAMNFGKSPAKLLVKGENKITFNDVAGIEEAKEELFEIVEFLKNPSKFTTLGGRIPKGVLCVGSPGTGKTLIAKAVAGEADRPFFSISGSDFVEMFVGVGASRIRDMFQQAKKSAPCIIFIDEIDAVGRHRGAGIGGGNDEREQTLNQLLVEMDGFDSNEGIILMAATNRPDVLDKALLRPGRFDRRVIIDLPDIKGRYEILKVHARKVKIDEAVDLMSVARATPGCSGADLANLLNEAALLAAKRGRAAVTSQETVEACDKVRFGKERRSLEIGEDEKRTTAYHEAGHTIAAQLVKNGDPVDKVTIIPRGFSLGATHFLPKKNRVSYWKKELVDQLIVLMGGRVAEEIFVHDASSGAQQDISQATELARSMVCRWGMSDALGKVAYQDGSGESSQYTGYPSTAGKIYSEETAQVIDKEVKEIIEEAYQRAVTILNDHKDEVELMTEMLMEFETLDAEDIDEIMSGKWDIEEKKERLNRQETKHRKQPPEPPKLEGAEEESSSSSEEDSLEDDSLTESD